MSHPSFGSWKAKPKVAYKLKVDAKNKKEGILRGLLGTDKTSSSFQLGKAIFTNTPLIIEYSGQPIFKYRIIDGEAKITTYIPQIDYWPQIEIIDNSMIAEISEFWDIEFRTNFVRFRKVEGKNFLSIDLRKENPVVECDLNLPEATLKVSPSHMTLNGNVFSGFSASNCAAGIRIGPRGHLVRPNFAQQHPRAFFLPCSPNRR